MFYGHLDKAPGLENEWTDDREPYKINIKDDRVFGRGVSEGAVNFIA